MGRGQKDAIHQGEGLYTGGLLDQARVLFDGLARLPLGALGQVGLMHHSWLEQPTAR